MLIRNKRDLEQLKEGTKLYRVSLEEKSKWEAKKAQDEPDVKDVLDNSNDYYANMIFTDSDEAYGVANYLNEIFNHLTYKP